MIASHYAEPLQRKLSGATPLRVSASEESEVIAELKAGDPFDLLDNSLGWGWGYGGPDRLVGYVPAESLG